MNPTDKNAELKAKFLEYYRKMPIKKYASYYIGKDEDTTRVWEKEDSVFSDSIRKAKSEYLLAKGGKLRPEFIVPVLFRELTPRTEVTGKEGQPLTGLVIIKDGSTTEQVADPGLE